MNTAICCHNLSLALRVGFYLGTEKNQILERVWNPHVIDVAYKDKNDPRYRAARRKHYRANKDQYLARNAKVKAERVALIREIKNRPCADCNESYPYYVMDFDHRDPSVKVDFVGRLLTGSLKKLMSEIEKCDVVCANCHRERTHGSVPLGGEESPKLLENKQQGSTPCTPVLLYNTPLA